MAEEKNYPHVVVGVFIENDKEEIFLMRSPKWGDRLIIPGGHIEYGENIISAIKREIKEETDLNIENVEFVSTKEIIKSEEFIKDSKRHFICLDYSAKLSDKNQEAILDGREGVEYFWMKPKDILKRNDIENATKGIIEDFFVNKKKVFSKKCKSCEKHKKEALDYKQGWQRALADYKNLQDEFSGKKQDWIKMSELEIVEEFLPVYENLKLATQGLKADGNPWLEGVNHVIRQFSEILKNHNLEEIKTVGEQFDPEMHEAVGEEELEDKEKGEILKEVAGGYKIGKRVIKAAKVIVNK